MSGTSRWRDVGSILAVFAAVGLVLGIVEYLGIGWAGLRFVAAAQGGTAERFGPIFVGVVAFQGALVLLVAGVVLAAVTGLLFGSRYRSVGEAALVTGVGALLGFYALSLLGALLLVFALGGQSAAQSVTLVGVAVRALEIGVPVALLGAVTGALGSRAMG